MQDSEDKHWLDQLEVTGPIKGIMSFVDELSQNYDRRVAALHVEYQNDMEEILACYKTEKQEFSTQLADKDLQISRLETELKSLQQSYNTLNVEYKLAKDGLETAKQELSELTKVLKNEEELLSVTEEKIRAVNTQIKLELAARGVEPVAVIDDFAEDVPESPATPPKKIKFKRTRQFLNMIVANRLQRPIVLRPKNKPFIDEIY